MSAPPPTTTTTAPETTTTTAPEPTTTTAPETTLPPQTRFTEVSGNAAPVVSRVPTDQPVVFLTIDDGWTRDPRVIDLVKTRHLPVSVFLITSAGRSDPAYFRALMAAGATIEDHTLSHPRLARMGLASQQRQVCESADDDARTYGARPTLFRPPYGSFDTTTQQAARACGMAAVVTWTATVTNGRLAVVGGALRAGDILLLHFRPTLYGDLQVALNAIAAAHLLVAPLQSYLPGRPA